MQRAAARCIPAPGAAARGRFWPGPLRRGRAHDAARGGTGRAVLVTECQWVGIPATGAAEPRSSSGLGVEYPTARPSLSAASLLLASECQRRAETA
eukprot:762632-Hanusia_phi.AAC.1